MFRPAIGATLPMMKRLEYHYGLPGEVAIADLVDKPANAVPGMIVSFRDS
jgi:hypothetical protein